MNELPIHQVSYFPIRTSIPKFRTTKRSGKAPQGNGTAFSSQRIYQVLTNDGFNLRTSEMSRSFFETAKSGAIIQAELRGSLKLPVIDHNGHQAI